MLARSEGKTPYVVNDSLFMGNYEISSSFSQGTVGFKSAAIKMIEVLLGCRAAR